jgi:vanillate/3-O-methylgallate O-demethylase
MGSQSLEQPLRESGNPVDMLREAGGKWVWPSQVAREYTNWIDELRAVREACVLADLSHHQMDQVIEGPDAMRLLRHLCVNSFEGFDVGKAKQAVMCGPDGNFLGDGVLQHVAEERFVLSGKVPAAHWLAFHAETDEYDVTETIHPKSSETDDDPRFFTFQVQGPNAIDALTAAAEGSLPDVPFFNFGRVTVDGHEVRALRHGMAGEPGFELQGPYEYGEGIKRAILDAGEEYGIRRLGTRAYEPLSVKLGWVTTHVLPIYTGEKMRAYREWLDADSYEATYSIGGSFDSDDITDYYVTPVDIGYERLVSFDHEFVGREALEREVADPSRTRVTLVWDDDDVVDVYASLFRPGTPHKTHDLPRDRWGAHHDRVHADGDLVGISKSFAYSYSDREMLSLCSIDREYADPGTDVTLVWGENGGESRNPSVEPHTQKRVGATVAPSPYVDDGR